MMSNLTLSETLKHYYEASLVGIDPLIDTWPLMHSPLPIITIVLSYLLFIKKIGPKFMEKREPYDLKHIMLAYNAFQVVLCTYIVTRVTSVDNPFEWLFSFGCRFQADRDRDIAEKAWAGTYWYLIAKLLDLLDTVFFVLRKKSNQISFLHVYHHTLMASITWYYLKYVPAENGIFAGLVNSLVHVFMYIYYGLSALGPEVQKFLWWKKYITWIQLIQFVIVVLYMTVSMMFSCHVDRLLTSVFIVNGFIFLYLFGNFYRNTYIKKRPSLTSEQLKVKAN